MKKLATAMTLTVLMAAPAFAQSSAPEFGSGNIAPHYGRLARPVFAYGAMRAYARVYPGRRHFRCRGMGHHRCR